MKITQILILTIFFTGFIEAATVKTLHKLKLGDIEINVNIYEKTGRKITFFSPHHNEQTAIKSAKEAIEKYGGRLIEIESLDENKKPLRNLKFKFNEKDYSIDPNRIYTENGRTCNSAPEINSVIKTFADELLKMIFASDGKSVRENEPFIVAIHNNMDVSAREESVQSKDLTAISFIKKQSTNQLLDGIFQAQAEGVFLSNTEFDEDNFVILSTAKFLGHFANKGFNVVLQKSPEKLNSKLCSIDDGSLSVYSAQNGAEYICLETDTATGFFRQKQMFEAVYTLLSNQ